MDEKKVTTKKSNNLKNKKAVAKALSKTSTSKTKTSAIKKKKTAPKKKENTNVKNSLDERSILLSQEVKEKNESKTKPDDSNKQPTNKKIKKENVKVKETANKKIEKKSKKEIKLKENKNKKKQEEHKTKLVLPKEWQALNEKKEKENEANSSYTLTGKLKKSIFEEVDEETYKNQKKKEKESFKKFLLIGLIVILIVLLAFYLLFKYNENIRNKVTSYGNYVIGDKVKLKDGSIWYVVEDSKDHDSKIKLLKENNIDINSDSKYTAEDKRKYNGENKSEYNSSDAQGVAKYLDGYKVELEKKVGPIEEISLLTSKEFVKIRERMGFGQQWSTANWLANSKIGNWWVISSPKNDSVYVVTSTGAYRITKANSMNYVRPTIVISKENVEKVDVAVPKDQEKK